MDTSGTHRGITKFLCWIGKVELLTIRGGDSSTHDGSGQVVLLPDLRTRPIFGVVSSDAFIFLLIPFLEAGVPLDDFSRCSS